MCPCIITFVAAVLQVMHECHYCAECPLILAHCEIHADLLAPLMDSSTMLQVTHNVLSLYQAPACLDKLQGALQL